MRIVYCGAALLFLFSLCLIVRSNHVLDPLPNDAIIVNLPITLAKSDSDSIKEDTSVFLIIRFSQVPRWREIVKNFCNDNPSILSYVTEIEKSIEEKLHILAIAEPSLHGDEKSTTFTSAVAQLLRTAANKFDSSQKSESSRNSHLKRYSFFLTSSSKLLSTHEGVKYKSFLEGLIQAASRDDLVNALHPRGHSFLPDFILQHASPIMLYQTLDAYTGGTSAMRVLTNTLQDLGFPVLLCNNTNQHSSLCAAPPENSLVITGEWCDQVMASYGVEVINTTTHTPLSRQEVHKYQFKGRGVQYFLGFHPGRHFCRGFIPLANSHYVHHTSTSKSLSAYYLGCPMTELIEEGLLALLESILLRRGGGILDVYKENLLVLDPDYFTFYTPERKVAVHLPTGSRGVIAENIMPKTMPNLFQRAKVVMDLALPGHERISDEAILFGAIPVISNRWNGASSIDFPAKYKIDAYNSTTIADVLDGVLKNYAEELQDIRHAKHWLSVASMWKKLADTANVVFSSSHLHFILSASTLHEEYIVNFQLLALIYLFPLCSVDVYVLDLGWYLRHHYVLVDLLRQTGYLRYDPLHPDETRNYGFDPMKSEAEKLNGYSFVRFRRLSHLESVKERTSVSSVHFPSEIVERATLDEAHLLPPWHEAVVVTFSKHATFSNSEDLLMHLHVQEKADESLILRSGHSSVLIMGPQAPVSLLFADFYNRGFAHPLLDKPILEKEDLAEATRICDLVNMKTRTNELLCEHRVVCGVVDSALWRAYDTFAAEMNFECV